ncbi:hypothetical protein R1sor_005072 [Riccia sorocarpa]|uniref:Uncharacterized protein n=1 Tax=Riccia sorocarpa TaxID=122646 RepID=A0ABD3HMS1_9MARC
MTPPRSARAPQVHVLSSSTSPDRMQDPSTSSQEHVGSPTSPDREETVPSDNEHLVGFGSPMVPYQPDDDDEEVAIASLTSLGASDPATTSKGKQPVEHRSSFESEEIRISKPDRVKRRVADLDDEAGDHNRQRSKDSLPWLMN